MIEAGGSEAPGKPWWYRVPHVAVGLISFAVVGFILFTSVSDSRLVALGGGAVAGVLGPFVQGFAQAAYNERHSAGTHR